MTFKERRKRADAQKIANDFEQIESSFISFAQKLNKKRQAQMMKRVERVIPELIKNKDNKEEVEGILKSLKVPSSKEWRKGIERLLFTASETGILRAHLEMLRLKELFEFDETWTPDVIDEGYNYDVVLPEEARKFIRKNAYEIGVITEETVINRIRKELEEGLEEGLPPRHMTARVRETVGTWMSDWHAQTIARTETGKYYNAGRLARWSDPETNGFVEALQYDAILDTRTTDVCTHLDGRIISIEDQATISEMTPPNHFQCRSTWLPVTKYEEWEDDFDRSIKPEKGFEFKSPLPKILRGKKKGEKLVKPKPKYNPLTVTDPDIIRSMPDDQFKVAIGNVTDIPLKLSMIKERAEQMAIAKGVIQEDILPAKFQWFGMSGGEGAFELWGKDFEFFASPRASITISKFASKLQQAENDAELVQLIEEWLEKRGDNRSFAGFNSRLREALKMEKRGVTFKGFPTVEKRSREAEKLMTIKEPPKTANYRNATGLQQALKDGEAWMKKHLDNKLAPATGITLRFEYDLMRAYAIGARGTIHFGMYENDAGVIVHESGHVMHWNNKAVADLVNEFFEQRTKGSPKKTWKNSEGGTEWAYPDDFIHYYTGREYGWETRKDLARFATNGFKGQEVVSMGLQHMYSEPETFYKKDKDHFMFIYALMEGLF